MAGSFPQILGAKANTNVKIAGSITKGVFDETVDSWKIGEAAHFPTPIQKAQVDMIGRACHLAAGVEEPAAVRQKEAEAAAQLAAANVAAIDSTPACTAEMRKVKLSNVLSQTDESETTALSDDEPRGRELLLGSALSTTHLW